jgi:biotin transport system substrate-specific component
MPALALTSSRPASVDLLRSAHASVAAQVLGIVGFAVLAALGAQVRIYLWEIPITLQTFAVYGAGLFLGARNGSLSMVLYLALGMLLPVYAGDSYGPAYLFGAASAGYLLSYPLVALLIGTLSERWNTLAGSVLATLAGSAVLFTCGVTWLHFAAGHATWTESIVKGWLLFVVWDLAKIGLVACGYTGARRLTAHG